MAQTYENPIIRGFNPDPSIIRVGEDYYMVNSTFQYFPGVIIRHSKDLVHWEIIGHAFTENEYLNLSDLADSHGIWAPDISYHNGLFYIFAPLRLNNAPENTTGRLRRQLVATSKKPEGPYSKPYIIDVDSIDPSHFIDDDGKHYMITAPGITITPLKDDCSEKAGETVSAWKGTGERASEGPHILKKNGYYYAIVAEGGTGYGHRINVGRSKSLYGPYENSPYNPVMTQTNPEAKIQRTGHGKLVETQNGDWWAVYLCGRRNEGNYTTVGRETCLDPVTWTEDGWFIVNDLKGPSSVQKAPALPEHLFKETNVDDFDTQSLSLEWQFVRNPHNDAWSLSERKGFLTLTAGEFDLNEKRAYNTLVRRETEHHYTAITKMEFNPNPDEEAGLTCYYGINNYIKLCLTKESSLCVKLLVNKNGEMLGVGKKAVSSTKIYLKVETRGQKRAFYCSEDEQNWALVGVIEDCTFLCDEGVTVGKHHTGTMVGIYAFSGNKSDRSKAYFDRFSFSTEK